MLSKSSRTSLARNNPVIVIDCGSGYSKLGYSGNNVPDFVIPTCVCTNTRKRKEFAHIHDLDFVIGNEAYEAILNPAYNVTYPMKHGRITDWTSIEKFYEQALFKYLRCQPEDHFVMVTEPPLNPPENREDIAEIMFETFNVSGLSILCQSILSLSASWTYPESERLGLAGTLTGTVVNSGDGVTYVVPIIEGIVYESRIKFFPIAGRHITEFMRSFITEREGGIPSEQAQVCAEKVKEKDCYTCKDIAKEFQNFDTTPEMFIKEYSNVSRGRRWRIDVGYERFLGPELYFNPQMFSSNKYQNRNAGNNAYEDSPPLQDVIDNVIQCCPIDYRRSLYRNIILGEDQKCSKILKNVWSVK